MFVVRHLPDEASTELAGMVAEALGARVEQVPDLDPPSWSQVQVYASDRTMPVAVLRWVRGQERDLAQACHQLAKGAGISVDGGVRRQRRGPGGRVREEIDRREQGIMSLHRELGIEPGKTGRRRRFKADGKWEAEKAEKAETDARVTANEEKE
jgi:hypothetical protein